MKKFLIILGALAGALFTAMFAIKKIKQATKGTVKAPSSFLPVPDDPGKIYVKNKAGKWETAQLPEGVKYRDVKAAAIQEGNNNVVVEIKHKVVDRRNPGDPIPDNALDRFNKDKR